VDRRHMAPGRRRGEDRSMAIHYAGPTPALAGEFYKNVRDGAAQRETLQHVVVAALTGRAFVVPAGHVARIVCHAGPQIVDVMIFNRHDPRERLWANQTLNREGICLSTFSRLWGSLPMFRPLMTIVEDTVKNVPSETTARHHCILGAHCNPRFWRWGLGTDDHPFAQRTNCFYNLLSAIEPFGLGREDVHDNLNLFQKIGILPNTGELVMEPSDALPGDHVDFYAELDVLMAFSLCPQGSGANPPTTPDQDPRPVTVEIQSTGIDPLPTDVEPV
jgi:uncharacterized protein YcgI (DUF1989 family)